MSTTQPAKSAKRIKYPHFVATGFVDVYEHGDTRPTITVKASCYISFQDEAYRLLVRDAKHRLELIGISKERIDALFFEGSEITNLTACEPKGVRQVYGEPTEAFFDSSDLKKRDMLIRQRRLVPYDQADMLAIYGPKVGSTVSEVSVVDQIDGPMITFDDGR